MSKALSKVEFRKNLLEKLSHTFGITPDTASDEQFYKAVALVCKDVINADAYKFNKKVLKDQKQKTVYYLCMEFLLGRSLKNNLYNLGLEGIVKSALSEFNIDLNKLYELEPDAGLGNGGLGRLAACYLDGLANGGYSAMGYSILYECGIFKQKLIDGWQTELPDFWLPGGSVWLFPMEEEKTEVSFGGEIESSWQNGFFTAKIKNDIKILAIPYDMYLPGKDGSGVATLRLWKSTVPSLDMKLFNQGDYVRAVENQAMAEVICKVLYPADNHPEGKSLRLRQQYFLVSASMQDVVKRHLKYRSGELNSLSKRTAIHINDTHPTLAIPELMRILLDDCGYSWDDAWEIVTQSFAYTNHTVMREALECWPEALVSSLIPRVYQIIKEIDNRLRAEIWENTHDASKVENMAVISNGIIRMANLCVAACHSVNGVSSLHSEILKESVFPEQYALYPYKFKNVTNGIAHRRWLCQSNPELSKYITRLIGDGFVHNGAELSKLKKFANDAEVLEKLNLIKLHNKQAFAKYLEEKQGLRIDPSSVFDVQVKRLHEYKRQHLNAFDIIMQYLTLRDNPSQPYTPRTYIFGAKAAPGYLMAKKLISFIYHLAELINNDPVIDGRIKVVYLEDYNVSTAERLMPAADISEQISLAGTEASGTGNMKLMINGAITLGTMDGANVEIFNSVGEKNIAIFGMSAEEVKGLAAQYNPELFLRSNEDIRRIFDFINAGFNGKHFPEIADIIKHDPYMSLADYTDYHRAHEELTKAYEDRQAWAKMSLMNIACAGIFSADRAVGEYAKKIWRTGPVK